MDETGLAETPDAGGRLGLRLLVALPVLAFVALAGLFALRLGAGDPSRLPSALIGHPVPSFTLPALPGVDAASGGPLPGLASRDLAGGEVTVVNVWASWCAPCQVEHPLLATLPASGIRLVGLDYKDKPEAARRFLTTLGNPFAAVGVDASGRTGIEWGVYGVPETFVVGPDGRIRYKHIGPLTPENLPGFLEQVKAAATAR